jgi:hypothetical protein
MGELAADEHGIIDTSKLRDPLLRDAFDKTRARILSVAAFTKKLDEVLDVIHAADTGGTRKGRAFDDDSLRGIEVRTLARVTAHPTPLLARIAALVGGPSPNFTLDMDERAQVQHHPLTAAVLAKADRESGSTSEALAQRHFTGEQKIDREFFIIDPNAPLWVTDNKRPEGHIRGAAGALHDVDVVMVKHHDSKSWLSAKVAKDGSFHLPLGDKGGEMSVWYQKGDGEKFFGGNIAVYGAMDDTIGKANWRATPGHMEKPPLAFVR